MTDKFKDDNGIMKVNTLSIPIREFKAFTKSDTVNETALVRGFHCNASGNVKCLLELDSTPVTIYVTAGVYYPYRVLRVYSTGTTADIVGIL